MNDRPRLLDLFCGAGGSAVGYHRAGFEVVGVDIEPQPHYPFEFHKHDALTYPLDGFDAVHASPPCQAYGSFANLNRARGRQTRAPRLIGPVRDRMASSGVPYVIENTERAPLRCPIKLCGSSFGLAVRRHRLFESNLALLQPGCAHRRSWRYVGVYGDRPGIDVTNFGDGYERVPRASTLLEGRLAMGIDWMSWPELGQAIPPAYTEFIGAQLLDHLRVAPGAA